MMARECELVIDLSGYWHAGTGRGGGENMDAVIDRDRVGDKDGDGLPLLRARHVKGLIREAADRLVAWQGYRWDPETRDLMFGRKTARGKDASADGCLAFTDSVMPAAVADAVSAKLSLAQHLTARMASTRMDPGRGIAKDRTLRSMEVAIPMRLYGNVTWAPEDRRARRYTDDEERSAMDILEGNWADMLSECLPFVLAVGAGKSRGYGRCRMWLSKGGPGTAREGAA